MKGMKHVFVACLLLVACSCKERGSNKQGKVLPKQPIIVFQPLGKFSDENLQFLKDSISKFYAVTVALAKEMNPPKNAWYQPRQRWIADSIIAKLKKTNIDSIRLTVGLMEEDISTKKGNVNNYGIMGLGYQPGTACVVSAFRLSRNIHSKQILQLRLFKVVAHEMGHNFGLPHCTDQHCIMVDAEGKMKLEGEKYLCNECKGKLKI